MSDIDYLRQFLDDPVVIGAAGPVPIPLVVIPITDDLDYLRRQLDDV